MRGAADKLAPCVGDMGWMPLSHPLSSILLISQAPACFSACSSFGGTGNFVFSFGEYQFLISCEPCLLLFLYS